MVVAVRQRHPRSTEQEGQAQSRGSDDALGSPHIYNPLRTFPMMGEWRRKEPPIALSRGESAHEIPVGVLEKPAVAEPSKT
ncbi:hypothetical protein GCM10009545_30100 [Saccharopolyspora thermophila]|uniref:Uncharacterized protein n=1 Tax=Saccharopolyspora thermophila TaxID=89367 RepID=A0ABN1CTQ5_9PSEU